ncbi:MAG: hypothetical protein HYW65_01840 [Candidatus Liptonbacteria bacterium]|nr:hypothetical protein [Candidatus Liptonbacteria bacterium]
MKSPFAIVHHFIRRIGGIFRSASRRTRLTAVLCAGFFVLAAVLLPSPAHAGVADFLGSLTNTFIGGILGGTVGFVGFVISYIVSAVVGFFTALVVFGIGVVLQLNTNIINSVAVQEGFKVTLSIANLGFVLGIIIIAIATILRYEHYGMKRLLIKLIAAALLVNFSLVIGGAIVNFSDRMSGVFLSAFPGGGGGATAFADAFAGAFGPQRPFLNQTIKDADTISSAEDLEKVAGAGSAGQSLGTLFVPLINLIFVAAILIVMFITIATFFFMLLVRYVYLGMLLILMPFAWLLWVFPLTEGIWKKWWDKFLKWTFFAPISLFFMWLVIITGQVMSSGNAADPSQGLQGLAYIAPPDSYARGLKSFVGSAANQVMGTFLQAAVLVGLAIGGLIAAEKFSITGSHAAMGAVKGIGKAAQGYVGKRARQAGGAILQKAGVQNAATALQQKGAAALRQSNINLGAGSKSRILRAVAKPFNFAANAAAKALGYTVGYAPGADYVAARTGRVIQAGVAGGRSGLMGGAEADVKDATKGLTEEQQANLASTMTAPQRVALVKKATKEGWLDKIDSKYYGPEEKERTFKALGQEKAYDDAFKASQGAGEKKPYAEEQDKARGVAKQEAEMWAERQGLPHKTDISEAGRIAYETAKTHGDSDKDAEERRNKAIAVARYRKGQVAYEEAKAHGDSDEDAEKARGKALEKAQEPSEYEKFVKEKVKKAEEETMADEVDPETGKKTGRKVNAQEKIKEITGKATEDLKKGDKVQYKEIFGDKAAFGLSKESIKAMGEVFAQKVAYSNQQLIPNIISKMSAKQFDGFKKMYTKILKDGIASTSGDQKKYLEEGLDRFTKKILAHHMTGAAHEGGGGEEEHAAPAPPPPSGGGTT